VAHRRALGGRVLADALPQGKTRETIELARDGHWFRLLVDPVLEADAVAGFVCIATDITVERQVAEARAALLAREQMAREDAEAANRAKDEFLAMLGHELRNPLDVIASAVNVLDEISSKDLPAVRTRAVIHRQVRQLARLVDDLLDVGRVSTGKIIWSARPWTSPTRCALRGHAGGRGTSRPPSARRERGATWVEGDQSRIEQIVMNLLWNAIKYTPAGGSISIVSTATARRRASWSPTPAWASPPTCSSASSTVRPGGAHARSRGGRPRHRPDPCPRLVELHGGRIAATSPGPGQGSTFVVELPQIPAPTTSGTAVEARGHRGPGEFSSWRTTPTAGRCCGSSSS
jgi:signal transduction histidine kinase